MNFRKSSLSLVLTSLFLLSGCAKYFGSTSDNSGPTETSATSTATQEKIYADYGLTIEVPINWETSYNESTSESGIKIVKTDDQSQITFEFSRFKKEIDALDDAELQSFSQVLRADFDEDATATLTSEGLTTIGEQAAYYVTWTWGSQKQFETTRSNFSYNKHMHVIQTTKELTSLQEDLDALQAMMDSIEFL